MKTKTYRVSYSVRPQDAATIRDRLSAPDAAVSKAIAAVAGNMTARQLRGKRGLAAINAAIAASLPGGMELCAAVVRAR
jgi:hypothetical protein